MRSDLRSRAVPSDIAAISARMAFRWVSESSRFSSVQSILATVHKNTQASANSDVAVLPNTLEGHIATLRIVAILADLNQFQQPANVLQD